MRRGAVVATFLAVVLAAAAVWCVWVIRSAGTLRDDVAQNVGLLERTRELRIMPAPARAAAAADLAARVRRLAPPAATPADALVAAAQRLDAAPDDAAARAELERAADGLVVALRIENRRVSIALGERWDSLNYVALTVLFLAGGLLAATAYSHRLRLRSEGMERALRARTGALQAAAAQWAGGDLSRPIPQDAAATDDFGTVLEQLRGALAAHVAELEARHGEIQRLADDLRAQLIARTEQLRAHAPLSLVAAGLLIAGQYELGAPLGAGGMGQVFRARRLSDGRQVAVKLLNQPTNPVMHARFVREARLMAEVSHPNVLRILDVGMHDGQPYLVTELVEGTTLAAESPPWPVERARPVLAAIARGLAAIHAHGIVHRDLKLANVMVGRTGASDELVKILDFGIARDDSADEVLPLPGRADDPLTTQGMLVGTLRYIAPEARWGTPLTPAADIFSFGVLAVRLLSGEFPWSSPILTLLGRGETPPRPSIDATLPDELHQLLVSCLALEPAVRPTAPALADALDALGALSAGTPSAPRPPPGSRRA